MVTFKPVGRMGNFLFEAASSLAYAWDHNLPFTTPHTTNDPHWNPLYLRHLKNEAYDPKLDTVEIREASFCYHPRPFKPEWKDGHNILFNGYWQTEKYFAKYRQRIIETFGFPWSPTRDTVSVHVRRGDYLTIKRNGMFKHPPVPKEWLEAQMAKFPGATFFFFSDDIGWCNEQFGKRRDVVLNSKLLLFSDESLFQIGKRFEGVSDIELDLWAMSCCEHHICSASTFSWWGAWLNRNARKRVLMPKHWITPGWCNLDFSDVVPKEWERV